MTRPVNKEDNDFLFDMSFEEAGVASATECTGLIPTPPNDEAECEAYKHLYIIPDQDKKSEIKRRM